MLRRAWPTLSLLVLMFASTALCAEDATLVFQPNGAAKGKSIVLISGDDEYRSEQTMPQLAKILSSHHGFRCTVLFAIDKHDGTIRPDEPDNIPGLEALDTADLLIILTRFRNLPDSQMRHIANYVDSGRPIIGMRTATHAFQLDSSSSFANYSWNSPDGGFGRRVLGETWISHHSQHGKQSTKGLLNSDEVGYPILEGIRDGEIWSKTDVYEARLPLPGDSKTLVFGEVLSGMLPTDAPVAGAVNHPMMPIAWVKTYKAANGKSARVFTTTLGTSEDLLVEADRRLLVNACYWALGMEKQIKPNMNVSLVGNYHPTPFGFGMFIKNMVPSDFR